MNIYSLTIVLDNPAFEGFGAPLTETPSFLGRKYLADDFVASYGRSFERPDYEVEELAAKWQPIEVKGDVEVYNDFPGLNLSEPVFSQRAVERLGDYLELNGELLRLSKSSDQYFFYNITSLSHALDLDKSAYSPRIRRPGCADVEYFSINESKFEGYPIFRFYEYPTDICVTQEFVERALLKGLNGFSFTKIWPLEPGELWRMADDFAVHLNVDPEVSDAGLEKIELVYNTSDKRSNREEKKNINLIVRQLNAQLKVQHLKAGYFGSISKKRNKDFKYLIEIECPNAEKTLDKLEPWLRDISTRYPISIST